jgi:hypothetical protein
VFIDEIKSRLRVVSARVGQGLGDDHTRSIGTEIELPPGADAAPSVLDCGPLPFAPQWTAECSMIPGRTDCENGQSDEEGQMKRD